MKFFVRLFLCITIPLLMWFTRAHTMYPQTLGYQAMKTLSPDPFYLQPDDYTIEDISWAKIYLRDSIGITHAFTPEEKAEKIAQFLVAQLHAQMHESSDELLTMSPLEQFKQIRYAGASFYCSNYVAIYGFFARVAGLAVRDIELKSESRWHIVSETWNPDKQGWMLSDLTHQIPLFRDHQAQFLSMFDDACLSYLPESAKPDYALDAVRFLHQQNNALHLKKVSTKLNALLVSRPSIIPIQAEGKALLWPVLLKYVFMLCWLFLVKGFIRA